MKDIPAQPQLTMEKACSKHIQQQEKPFTTFFTLLSGDAKNIKCIDHTGNDKSRDELL